MKMLIVFIGAAAAQMLMVTVTDTPMTDAISHLYLIMAGAISLLIVQAIYED